MKKIYENKTGGAILWISAVSGVFGFLILNYLTANANWRAQSLTHWNQIVSEEAAQSAFILMEAALERRLWEMPPDANCKRLLNFSLNGVDNTKATFEVKAEYLPDSKLLTMTSKANYQGQTSSFEKNLVLGDVTDFLIWSRTLTPTTIKAGYWDTPNLVKMIGKHRKIYFEGPVDFNTVMRRPGFPPTESRTFADNAPMLNPKEIKYLIQSERMIFQKGLDYYKYTPAYIPDGRNPDLTLNQPNFYNLFLATFPTGSTLYRNSGGAYFTSNYADALDVLAKFETNTPINMNLLKKHLYPKALFCQGSAPFNSETGIDNGCYMDDPDKWLPWEYKYGGISNAGESMDFLCFSPPTTTKGCAHPDSFPKGFTAWRANANLEGTFLTKEVEIPDVPIINWDNMDALREDAEACGVVIDSTSTLTTQLQDCEIDRWTTLYKYRTNQPNPCTTIHQFNTENLATKLNNFNTGLYSSTKKNELSRRIIYSKVPLEIKQTGPNGLALDIADASIREKISLWFVSEDTHYLMPNQPDTTSPLDVDPGRPRENYFNAGPSATEMKPLQLTFLSPEKSFIHSPFRKRTTYSELQTYFPIISGKIKPTYSIVTDWVHQEDDGFKYGIRNVIIKNTVLLDNGDKFKYSEGFNLVGLWSGRGQYTYQIPENHCFLSDGDPKDVTNMQVPPNHRGVLIPPITSKFYDQTTSPPTISNIEGWPKVFEIQIEDHGMDYSLVELHGNRIGVKFSDVAPTGKRRLDQPALDRVNNYAIGSNHFDFTARKVNFPLSNWYYPIDPNKRCDEIFATSYSSRQLDYVANRAEQTFLQSSPSDSFTESGSLYSFPLPIVKTRNE